MLDKFLQIIFTQTFHDRNHSSFACQEKVNDCFFDGEPPLGGNFRNFSFRKRLAKRASGNHRVFIVVLGRFFHLFNYFSPRMFFFETAKEHLFSAFGCPVRKKKIEYRSGLGIRVNIEIHIQSGFCSASDHVQDLVYQRPVSLSHNLQMGNFEADIGLFGKVNRFIKGTNNSASLVPQVDRENLVS